MPKKRLLQINLGISAYKVTKFFPAVVRCLKLNSSTPMKGRSFYLLNVRLQRIINSILEREGLIVVLPRKH